MIKTLIIEDEENAANGLIQMLKLVLPDVLVLGCCSSIKKSLEFLKHQSVDLVFLDIVLRDGTGLELLERIEERDFEVIFTTAYSDYAIKAFKFNAIDYLLKPIEPSDLVLAVERARKRTKEKVAFAELLSYSSEKKHQKIRVSTQHVEYLLDVEDIYHLKAEGAYTLFTTSDNAILVSKNIGYYEDLLVDFEFMRCHQSYLVNMDKIQVMSGRSLDLENGDQLPVSMRKFSQIKERIKDR
jgi:two-component system LytT family response regulator|tara:strand:- start:3097 stop:3819 length:723 start_codon:yes stop_codon:yes gene_type:complete